ncbi:class I SAM-dependent methyltransferase [Parasediminibacterium paludis]|uniref:Class I SAM-dependent methyltransferase n=1 Tax=Parasediminibacterium paludis TaxID=908966 RepID=A0ABV8PTL2_9BACT
MTSSITTKWNAGLYDTKHDFVFKYGEDLVDMLQPQAGERILDLGCGTGHLTNIIAKAGATAIGIDSSIEMIAQAKASYPPIEFLVRNAADFFFDNSFDAIFSNAVLHWVPEKEKAIDCMYRNLKRTGRLVIEMGGKRNVEKILTAFNAALAKHGFAQNATIINNYFPSVDEYSFLLEKRGFKVTYAAHYSRETELKDTNNGIKDWIKMFRNEALKGIPNEVVELILEDTQEALRQTHFRNGKWYADYKRLRIVAIK